MKIGLLGIGTVGKGVREQLAGREDMGIQRILVRREIPELGELATRRIEDILEDPEIDTVVELMGGMEPAYSHVLRALRAGKNVVTANKLMLSYHMEELLHEASARGVQLRFDASVGGGIPYLYNLMRTRRTDEIFSISGIVNGTTNMILDTMQSSGADFSDVLAQAQRAGYAEADPSSDIDGIDARSKLCIAASVAFGKYLHPEEIAVAGIRNIASEDVLAFKRLGYTCRLLVRAERISENSVCAFVEPTLINPLEPESTVRRNDNLIGLVGRRIGQQYFFGQGAGKDPTAYSVVLGLTEIQAGERPFDGWMPDGRAMVDNSQLIHRYYVRTTTRLSIPAEKLRGGGGANLYLTSPLPVDRMHALAASLRLRDPNLFFAGVRG